LAPSIAWRFAPFAELTPREVHDLYRLRAAIFVVEQNCAYQDLDGLDQNAEHLIAWSGKEVAGYLRVLAPGTRFADPSIGRIITTQSFRGSGLGREIVAKGIERARMRYPGRALRISGQVYLQKFYESFGFQTVSEQYLEDGIPHVEMLLQSG
jgi:ElaA protein